MMTEPILNPRERCNLVIKTDKNVAKCHVALYEENLQLHDLTAEQKVLILFNEKNLNNRKVNDFNRKEYLYLADNKNNLINIYYSHQLVNQCDEEHLLLEGLILNEKHLRLLQLFEETKSQLSIFTYSDFLNGILNVVFYELNQKPTFTSSADYCKMRNWQIKNKVECVSLLFGKIRERFIEKLGDSATWKDAIRLEINQLENLFRNANHWTTEQFITRLLLLLGLDPDSLPDDKTEFHQLFCKFIRGKNYSYSLSPKMLNAAHEHIESGKISNAPIFGWSLIKYKRWLSHVLKGKIDLFKPTDCDYEQVLEQTYHSGLFRSHSLIAEFKHRNPSGTISQKKYKSVIEREMKKLRTEFNQMECPDYYKLLLNKENVKYYFIDHCLLDIGFGNQACHLRKAIVLNERIKFFKSELYWIDESLIKPSMNIAVWKNHFTAIISAMIPDSTISERLWCAFSKTIQAVRGRKPILFIIEDLKDDLRSIFKEAIRKLKILLDKQSDDIIAIYAETQLKELEMMAIISSDFGGDLNDYLNDLKALVELKLTRYQVRQSFNLADIGKLIPELPRQEMKPENNMWLFEEGTIPNRGQQRQEMKPDTSKPLAFYYKTIKDEKIRMVYNYLIKIEAISPDTTFSHFCSLFNGKEVTRPVVWQAAQGDLMVFIREMVKINGADFAPYNQHWNIAVKCFVPKGGTESFDPQKLRNSKPTANEQKLITAARKFR